MKRVRTLGGLVVGFVFNRAKPQDFHRSPYGTAVSHRSVAAEVVGRACGPSTSAGCADGTHPGPAGASGERAVGAMAGTASEAPSTVAARGVGNAFTGCSLTFSSRGKIGAG